MEKFLVSFHALEKGKERQGLNEKALERIAVKALKKGIDLKDTKGALKHYIEMKSKMQMDVHDNVILKVYGEFLYIYTKSNDGITYLLTTYQIPKKYRQDAIHCIKTKNNVKK